MTRAILSLSIGDINIDVRVGFYNADHAAFRGASMASEGQHDPIHVRRNGNAAKQRWTLVAGLHRIRGAEGNGWSEIDAIQVANASASTAELLKLEVSENLNHRQLRPIERAIFMAERARLEEEADHPGRAGEASQARALRQAAAWRRSPPVGRPARRLPADRGAESDRRQARMGSARAVPRSDCRAHPTAQGSARCCAARAPRRSRRRRGRADRRGPQHLVHGAIGVRSASPRRRSARRGRWLTPVARQLPSLADYPIPSDVAPGPGWCALMVEMAAHIGAFDTLAICEALGGQDIYVPIDADRSPFAETVGREKHPKSPLVYEGKDEAAAHAAAIANAIADGAIKGVSPAVAKALQSSSDIDKALAEALKVRDVERLIGGVAGQIKQLFVDADTNAAERVRVARAYGLDLLAVERLNAEERVDLVARTLKSRVGSLQDVLKSLQYGDLFEGDAATQLAAIRTEIDKVKVDAEAGKEGSADTLAELYRNLVATSREAYGTAGGEYAADRSAAVAGIERVVQIENDRINAAANSQAATTAAVTAGNALVNEGNDLMVRTNDLLSEMRDYMAKADAKSSAVQIDLASVRRYPV